MIIPPGADASRGSRQRPLQARRPLDVLVTITIRSGNTSVPPKHLEWVNSTFELPPLEAFFSSCIRKPPPPGKKHHMTFTEGSDHRLERSQKTPKQSDHRKLDAGTQVDHIQNISSRMCFVQDEQQTLNPWSCNTPEPGPVKVSEHTRTSQDDSKGCSSRGTVENMRFGPKNFEPDTFMRLATASELD